LDEISIKRLVICGLATDSCVKKTALDAREMDYQTYIPYDTTSSTTLEKYIEGLKEIETISRYNGDLKACFELEPRSFGQYSEWYIGYRTTLQKQDIEKEYSNKWGNNPKEALTWLLGTVRKYQK